MNKKLFFPVFICLVLILSFCKKDSSNNNDPPSILEADIILDLANDKFYEFAAQTDGDPGAALFLTMDWVLTQETVEYAAVEDSTYLRILLKSGLRTVFSYIEADLEGRSIYRGSGGSGTGDLKDYMNSNGCTNEIVNKKVLIYAAAYNSFYFGDDMIKILNLFTDSEDDYEVTLLKDSQCTVEMLKSFGNYGFVIIDTHGFPDGLMIGTSIESDTKPKTEEEMKKLIIDQAGQEVWDMMLNGDISYWKGEVIQTGLPQWYLEPKKSLYKSLFVTSKYINSLPEWKETMIFGNMCYSAANKVKDDSRLYSSPLMRTAFINRKLISYYGYSFDDDYSKEVTDQFSKQMEDSLVRAFVIDGDSTGKAYLKPDKTEFNDKYRYVKLKLKHYNADDYCYSSCGVVFTDSRDGHKYKTVCIGDQVWMAENLNYDTTGSQCYDFLPANCDTYGRLYDWATVMNGAASSNLIPSGVQGICPKGWHVPSNNEWQKLIQVLGGSTLAGGAMKTVDGWDSPNVGATNSSGFSALPAGTSPDLNVGFNEKGVMALFWSSAESTSDPATAGHRRILNSASNVYDYSMLKTNGLSLRCVKD
jgi:uncharacterized protein (TIGR02145 family)